jgi:hypothetical protein
VRTPHHQSVPRSQDLVVQVRPWPFLARLEQHLARSVSAAITSSIDASPDGDVLD